jgi:hypothetical protein
MVSSFITFFYILLVTLFIMLHVFLLLCIFYYYEMRYFVCLSILILTYVPFCVFCLIVLFCVVLVCKYELNYCYRDVGALFDYTNWGFPMLFPQLLDKRQGITREDGARPAFHKYFWPFIVMCVPFSVFCVLFVCNCVLCYCHRVSIQFQLINNNSNTAISMATAPWTQTTPTQALTPSIQVQ